MSLGALLFLDKSTVKRKHVRRRPRKRRGRLRLVDISENDPRDSCSLTLSLLRGETEQRDIARRIQQREREKEREREREREARRHYHKNARNLEDVGFMSERRWLARDKFRRIESNRPRVDKTNPRMNRCCQSFHVSWNFYARSWPSFASRLKASL